MNFCCMKFTNPQSKKQFFFKEKGGIVRFVLKISDLKPSLDI